MKSQIRGFPFYAIAPTTPVATKPARNPGAVGAGVAVFLAGIAVALFTLSYTVAAAVIFFLAAVLAAVSGASLWSTRRSVTNPDQ